MSKPFRPAPLTPKPCKGWMPARVVLGLLSAPFPTSDVASLGLKAIEQAADTLGAQKAWDQALSELPVDPQPVLFSTVVDTATYLAVLAATHAHGLTLEQGMAVCFHQGLKNSG